MKKLFQKDWLLAAVAAVNLMMLIFQPQTEKMALQFTGKTFLHFLFVIPPIFVCMGLMDLWIKRESMRKIMGEKSGFKGMLIALLLGAVTAVPLYALLLAAGMLLKKGGRIANVLLFLGASASIRIPLLLFEISSLGWKFTFLRFGLNLLAVFAIAFLIEKLLTDADKKTLYKNADQL